MVTDVVDIAIPTGPAAMLATPERNIPPVTENVPDQLLTDDAPYGPGTSPVTPSLNQSSPHTDSEMAATPGTSDNTNDETFAADIQPSGSQTLSFPLLAEGISRAGPTMPLRVLGMTT